MSYLFKSYQWYDSSRFILCNVGIIIPLVRLNIPLSLLRPFKVFFEMSLISSGKLISIL